MPEELKGKRILTLKETAEYLGLSPVTLANYVRAKRIPSLKANGKLRFDAEELDAWRAIPKGHGGKQKGSGYYARMRRGEA